MSVKRVTPDEAAALAADGWLIVDVRSIPEFEQGHPAGAYNVPLQHRSDGRLVANPAFLAVVERTFARDSKLVMSCRSGNRSLTAARMLLDAGFVDVVDMRAGMVGERQAGTITCEGWLARGLPVAQSAEPGRSYAELEE